MLKSKSNSDKYSRIYIEFTKWDKLVVRGPLTLKELIEQQEQKYGIDIESINCNGSIELFNLYGDKEKSKLRLDMRV